MLRSTNSNAESPKGFKCTRTFWSCNLMHIKVLLYALAHQIPTWQVGAILSEWMSTLSLGCPSELTHHHSQIPASSWKHFHSKSTSSSLSHHTETVTDSSGLEDSFLTVSSSSWAVSEWDLQQMRCRLNKLQCSLSLRGVITSHAPSAAAKLMGKGGKQNMSLQHAQGKSSHSTTAKVYSFGHSHFTVMWWLSCPWGELILTNITSMSNHWITEIPQVMDNWGHRERWESFQHLTKTCIQTYHPFIHAVTYIIHHEESLQVPSVGLSRQNPLLFALLLLK